MDKQMELPIDFQGKGAGNKRAKWSASELQMVRDWYVAYESNSELTLDALAKLLGRSVDAIHLKGSRLGLGNFHRPKKWHDPQTGYTANGFKIKNGKGYKKPKYGEVGSKPLSKRRSESAKKYIKEYGHPRGALGMKHSETTKQIIADKNRRHHAALTRKDYKKIAAKQIATNKQRYGRAGPPHTDKAYSRTKGGRRHDLGGMYFRSAWEANYARYLNWLISIKNIKGWRFEAVTFHFGGIKRGTLSYTPDFEVTELDGKIKFHEVKGWMDQKSKVRLKRMKKYHPSVELVLIDEKQYKAIKKMVSKIIPNWE